MKLRTPIIIGLDHQIQKKSYIGVVTKEQMVRKHFAVLDKIIFYDIISK